MFQFACCLPLRLAFECGSDLFLVQQTCPQLFIHPLVTESRVERERCNLVTRLFTPTSHPTCCYWPGQHIYCQKTRGLGGITVVWGSILFPRKILHYSSINLYITKHSLHIKFHNKQQKTTTLFYVIIIMAVQWGMEVVSKILSIKKGCIDGIYDFLY